MAHLPAPPGHLPARHQAVQQGVGGHEDEEAVGDAGRRLQHHPPHRVLEGRLALVLVGGLQGEEQGDAREE